MTYDFFEKYSRRAAPAAVGVSSPVLLAIISALHPVLARSGLFLLLQLLTFQGFSGAAAADDRGDLTALRRAAAAYIEEQQPKIGADFSVGVLIGDAESGEVIFEKNGRRPLIPASILKLLTTYAALKILGSDYVFPTEVFLQPEAAGLSAAGRGQTIYLRGHGDPEFKNEQAGLLAEQLASRGVRKINDLVVDQSLFIDPPAADGSNPYQAALSAVSINNNSYLTVVAAAPRDRLPAGGQAPALVSLTPGARFALVNHALTIAPGSGKAVPLQVIQTPGSAAVRPQYYAAAVIQPLKPPQVALLVKGTIETDAPAREFYQTVPDPAAYYASIMKYRFEQNGITVGGRLMTGVVPDDAALLLTFNSISLVQVLSDLNHYSSNFMAGQLLYALGRQSDGRYSRSVGIKKMEAVLSDLSVPEGEYSIADGSGLDAANRISVWAIHRILHFAVRDFSIAPDFISSLGRFGRTGTVRKRRPADRAQRLITFDRFDPADSIWAKTGTIDKVSSLAGLLETPSGKRLTFVIISNGPFDPSRIKGFEDGLLAVLLKN